MMGNDGRHEPFHARPGRVVFRRALTPALLGVIGMLGVLAGCGSDDDTQPPSATRTPSPTSAPTATSTPDAVTAASAATGHCIDCHTGIEMAHGKYPLGCTHCHTGDPLAVTKEAAHVAPLAPLPRDATTLPVDYFDTAYLQFQNPSNLRVVRSTCGRSGMAVACHGSYVDDLMKSMMATTAGHLMGGGYQSGILPNRTAQWANFPTSDDDGDVPAERGALASLVQVPDETPFLSSPLSSYQRHYADVPRKICTRCHLWSRGNALRGATGQEGNYRSEGCAACHMPYTNAALSESGDPTINKAEPGHPRVHEITRRIPTDQCTHCHTRGARIGLSFRGLAQAPAGTATGPNYPGLTPAKLHGGYQVQNPEVNPPDIHYERGLECIDCHVRREVMGDGNIFGHMHQAVEIRCESCHGTPNAYGPMQTSLGTPLPQLRWENGEMLLRTKIGGTDHVVKQVKDIVDPAHPSYNPLAAEAMNADHLKDQGGVECYACHAAWQPNCYGCHFKRDLSQSALDMLRGTQSPGKPTTDDRYFVSFKSFQMGHNSRGKVSPYLPGCQVLATVIDANGQEILRQEPPVTAAGLSGLALNPKHTHTNRRTARFCVECHRNPAALGLGTESYNLSRTHLFTLSPAPAGALTVIDRLRVTAPSVVGTIALPDPRGLAVVTDQIEGKATVAYVADAVSGLVAIDLADPAQPRLAATVPVAGARALAVAGRTLYVAAGAGGLRTFDLAAPLQPRELGGLPTTDARAVAVHGLHVLIADGAGGLVIADVRNPGSPAVVATLDLNGDTAAPNDARDVVTLPHYSNPPPAGIKPFSMIAYVTDGAAGVRIVDISDPRAPVLVTTVPADDARAIRVKSHYDGGSNTVAALEREYLFIANGSAGVSIVNVSDPWSPQPVTAIATAGPASALFVANAFEPPNNKDYAYIGMGAAGLAIVDVTDINAPVQAGSLPVQVATGIDLERIRLDRMVDEDGQQIKDVSHDGARPFRRDEIERLLGVTF